MRAMYVYVSIYVLVQRMTARCEAWQPWGSSQKKGGTRGNNLPLEGAVLSEISHVKMSPNGYLRTFTCT